MIRHTSRLAALAAIAAGALAAGCDHPRLPDALHPEFTDTTRRHPIVVAPQSETVAIPVGPHGVADGNAYIEAARFLRQYKRDTRGPLFVAVPANSRTATGLVKTIASREGIAPEQIRWQHKRGDGTLTLSYDRIAAIGPQCGDWGQDITRNPERLPYPNFGCTAQHNLAAMAANPTDLAFSAKETPRIGNARPWAPKNSGAGGGGGSGGAAAAPNVLAQPSAAPALPN